MVQQIRSTLVQQAVRAALLGSVVAGFSLLCGCEDSVTGQASKTAMVNTEKAARIAASAGDGRPSQKLIDGTARPLDEAAIKKLSDQAKKLPEAETLVTNVPPATMPAESVEYRAAVQKFIDNDLATAQSLLADALHKAGLPDQPKALLETQSGYNQAQQAQQALTQMEAKLEQLENLATALQSSALDVTALAKEIEIRQESRDVGIEKLNADLTAAQGTLEKTKQAADEQEHLAKSLESELDSLRQRADDLNHKAQAQMQAAAQMRGQASIDAFDAGAKVRGEAAQLASDLAGRTPELLARQHDAVRAQIKVHEAEERVKTITATKEAAGKSQAAIDSEVASLHTQIKHIVNDGDNALAKQYAEYTKLRGEIEGRIKDVATTANAARTSLEHAAKDLDGYASYVKTNDPKEADLIKLADNKDLRVLLHAERAAASFAAAEASIIGMEAAQLEKGLSPNLADAVKAAGSDTALTPDIDKKIADYRQAAYSELHDHAQSDLTAAEHYLGGSKTKAPAWVTLNLKAAVFQASSMVAPDADKAKDAQTAQEAVRDALAANPGLAFPGITPAGGGAGNP